MSLFLLSLSLPYLCITDGQQKEEKIATCSAENIAGEIFELTLVNEICVISNILGQEVSSSEKIQDG